MKIEVKYFARFREITGTESEQINTDASDITSLMDQIIRMHPDLSGEKNFLIALNEKFADSKDGLKEGDTVAVLPPVSGG